MITELDNNKFKQILFDTDAGGNMSYKGSRPSVIEFYVTWCPHCQAMAPRYNEVSNDVDGKVDCFRVELEQHPEIGEIFGIKGFPTFLFVQPDGGLQAAEGEMSRNELRELIRESFRI